MNLLKEIEIKKFENKEVSSLKVAEDELKKCINYFLKIELLNLKNYTSIKILEYKSQ